MASSEEYTVGYKRPPKHTRFKKGQSGNPKGRPKRSRNVAKLLEEEIAQPIRVQDQGRERTVTRGQAIVKTLVLGALKGDNRKLQLLLQYLPQVEETPTFDPLPEDRAALEDLKRQLEQPDGPE